MLAFIHFCVGHGGCVLSPQAKVLGPLGAGGVCAVTTGGGADGGADAGWVAGVLREGGVGAGLGAAVVVAVSVGFSVGVGLAAAAAVVVGSAGGAVADGAPVASAGAALEQPPSNIPKTPAHHSFRTGPIAAPFFSKPYSTTD
jgi:hypothetical protein